MLVICDVLLLTSQQHASVSQGRICSYNRTCCHTETEASHQTCHLTQPQYTDTRPSNASADPIMPAAWQGAIAVPVVFAFACLFACFLLLFFYLFGFLFLVHWYDSTWKNPPMYKSGVRIQVCRSRSGRLTVKPTRRSGANLPECCPGLVCLLPHADGTAPLSGPRITCMSVALVSFVFLLTPTDLLPSLSQG